MISSLVRIAAACGWTASSVTRFLENLLREKGHVHEVEVLGALESRYGAATRIPEGGSISSRMNATLHALRSGVRLIYQGVFTHGLWQGRPDFLVWTESDEHSQIFEIHDAKLLRDLKASIYCSLEFMPSCWRA